ncbi:ATP-binding cassette domain-containing protein [Albimonas pacifica]|uniref:Peptide/nickel transport system ATP-binding protein/peptide/nickel transport system ATP-binding protein n=1 Tax=Albimonas pacifica TaxID=1114924 RepID=A0A1I3GBS7_9RHOB|nr:ABC transporter ATP-binding protein [Albimonas pacifica]SFI20985.1 peptide/nickel transport system ATP-binding protein/peptide/nickel transport system ATP-binding protein [Albimonas pacifica]
MTPLLRIEDLRVAFGGRQAVDGASLEIAPGEILALAGESGAGKSALAAALLGLIPPPGRVTGGRILFAGLDLATLPEAGFRPLRGLRIATVVQDPSAALDPMASIGAQLVETLRLRRGLARGPARARAEALLAEAGLPEPAAMLSRPPHRLSGGQRQRAVIALALAGDPELLVADEPTASLDVAGRAALLALLRRLCRDRGMAALLIGHDLAAAAACADRVAVMQAGRIVETGPPETILRAPSHPWTRAMAAALPRLDAPGPVARAPQGPAVLALEGVGLSYARRALLRPAPAAVLQDVSLSLRAGESLGLVGASGSGKSSVARLAAGLLRPDVGRVRREGTVQMVFQDALGSLNPRMTAGEIVAEPVAHLRLAAPGAPTRAEVARLLEAVGLPPDAAARRPLAFSGGQRQRIAIARALAARPALLIADEPTSALDVTTQERVLALLARLQAERGFAMLFVTHDLAVARAVCPRLAVMEAGRVVEQGPAAAILDAPRSAAARRLVAAARAMAPA